MRKRPDKLVDSLEGLLFRVDPRYGCLNRGTVCVVPLPSVLELVFFDDNFENVAFQGALMSSSYHPRWEPCQTEIGAGTQGPRQQRRNDAAMNTPVEE